MQKFFSDNSHLLLRAPKPTRTKSKAAPFNLDKPDSTEGLYRPSNTNSENSKTELSGYESNH